jgi:hypothetical protein
MNNIINTTSSYPLPLPESEGGGVEPAALALRDICLYNGKELSFQPSAKKGTGWQKPTKDLEN